MASIGADGLNGDTLSGFPRVFRTASDEAGRPLVLEPTDSPPAQALPWNTMSWGICWKYSFEPLVSTFKWLEPRHMVRVAPRWGHDKTHDLQFAFFNGAGFLSWENIWGIWNGLTARDSETLRRVAAIGRAFAPLLMSADWEPFAPTEQPGIYASRFPRADETLWLLVNRNDHDVSGRQLSVPSQAGLEARGLRGAGEGAAAGLRAANSGSDPKGREDSGSDPCQISSGTILIAPHGHSVAQMPQPLQ